MVRTRPWRQAHIWGLTYWTVAMPRARNLASSPMLKAGASMPTKTSGRRRAMSCTRRRRSPMSRGRCLSGSIRPMTDKLVGVGPDLAAGGAHPRPGDAEGLDRADALPQGIEQRGTENIPGGFAGNQPDYQRRRHAWLTARRRSAHQAARGGFDEIQQRLHFGVLPGEPGQLCHGIGQLQLRAVQDPVGRAQVADLFGAVATTLQPF